MIEACRVPTPAERHYGEALAKVQSVALERVVAALKDGTEAAAAAFATSGVEGSPPPYEYFAARLHQQLYCILCDADPDTFAGGNAKIAIEIIRNSQNIARHYWGAEIEPYRRS